ncbi:Tigger transposable element-derived protein 1 [Araneus ventricosus]|uniref:Tigger transposable element-derived protein 1 n=1 Tax=Araneus ventricosus TaxID=182803 RepID=A0A4Y2E9P4_ARAVE|nr:Tigger transposable element-derived protein 1 [Araneus ventricosus]
MFGSTHWSKQLFSFMKRIKTPVRSRITDIHLRSVLKLITVDKISLKVGKMVAEKIQSVRKKALTALLSLNYGFEINLHFYKMKTTYPCKQALLVLDNAPAHPPNLEDDILEEFKFIKVLYLPPNTTPVLQPMDQQVISNFKKMYTKHMFRHCFEVTENTNLTLREYWKDHFNIVVCLRMIDQAWMSVTTRTLTSAWKKLWPESVAERTFEGFKPEVPVKEEIVSLGKSMGLVMDERDMNELVEEHSQELTTEELQELQSQQHSGVLQEIGFEEEPEVEDTISTSEIKEILGMWERVSQFVEKKPRKSCNWPCIGGI